MNDKLFEQVWVGGTNNLKKLDKRGNTMAKSGGAGINFGNFLRMRYNDYEVVLNGLKERGLI